MKNIHLIIFLSLIFLPLYSTAQNNPRNIELNWKTDTSRHNVPLEEFTILLKPDGIPPIDDPKFWGKDKSMEALFEHEPVIAVVINNEARAYPLSILMFHEITNDIVGGVPVVVNYCPLCNSAIVFDRRLDFEGVHYLLDFGVSGMLRKSNLVMWDRQTESWWQQFTGEALVGTLSGAELKMLNSMLISLNDFFENYPSGKVLSTETGHFREYGTNPYTGYDNLKNNQPFLFKGETDERLPAMERIVNINIGEKYKIYPYSVIQKELVINDVFNNEAIVLFFTSKTVSVLDESSIEKSKEIGSVTVFFPQIDGKKLKFIKSGNNFIDEQSGSFWCITGKCIEGYYKERELLPIPHGNHFAFSWLSFYPDSEIYKPE